MGATTVEGKTLAPMGAPTESKRRRRIRVAHPAKLPYGGLNRIRFEGSVSTNAGGPARYPRFGVHFTMHGGRRPATPCLACLVGAFVERSLLRCSCLHGNHQKRSKLRSTRPGPVRGVELHPRWLRLRRTFIDSFERNFIEPISSN